MPKILKRFLLIAGIVLAVLLIGAVLLAGAFEKTIGEQIVGEINKQITSNLTVGDFHLSLIRAFPSAAANLQDVILEDNAAGVLLEAKEISFRIGLFSLFGSRLKVNSVVLSDGALNVQIDARGRANYDISKPTGEGASGEGGSETAISLKQARLRDMQLIYGDRQAQQEMLVEARDMTFSGEFSSTRFTLNTQADLFSEFVELEGTRYFVGKELGYDARMKVDLEAGHYDFEKVQVQVEDNTFNMDGYYHQEPELTDVDILLTSENSSLEAIVQLLPAQLLQSFGDLSSKGTFFFDAAVKGQYRQGENPDVTVKFGLQNGRVSSSRLEDDLKEVSFEASFTNGVKRSNRSSIFEINNFKGYLDRELVEFDLKVRNLDDPVVDFALDGVLPLESAHRLFGNELISGGSGEIEIKDLRVSGAYNDMIRASRVERVQASGQIEFDDAALLINEEKMTIDRGQLQLDNNLLTVAGVKLEGAGSEIELNGTFRNFLPVFLADSLNSNQAALEFTSTLAAKSLDIDRLLALTAAPVDESRAPAQVVDSLKVARTQKQGWLARFFAGTFDARIEEFNYGLIEGEEFTGNLTFDRDELLIRGSTKAMEGTFRLDGVVYLDDRPRLQAKLDCDGINAKEFFRQTENFGQDVLQDRHVSGTLNAKMAIFAYFDEEGNFLDDQLLVFAGIGIENGELKDFKMLEEFSSYVKVQDLRNIRFENMENWLMINKQTIYIPAMFIQSNAMNLTIAGEHNFDNEFEYDIKVNAGQVLATKFKKYNPNMEPIPAKRKGFVNLYVKVFGNLDNYDYEMAKKEVKQDFRRSEYRRLEIKSALTQAFGQVELIQEPPEWADIPEYDDDIDPGEVEYIEGFDQ